MLIAEILLGMFVFVAVVVLMRRKVHSSDEPSVLPPTNTRAADISLSGDSTPHLGFIDGPPIAHRPDSETDRSQEPKPQLPDPHDAAASTLSWTASTLKRRVGPKGRVPLWLPLAWIAAGLIVLAASWAISFNITFPPQSYAKWKGLVPTPAATPAAKDKPKKQTAKQKRAAKKRAEKAQQRFEQEHAAALQKLNHEIRIPVWWLVFGLPVAAFFLVMGFKLLRWLRRKTGKPA